MNAVQDGSDTFQIRGELFSATQQSDTRARISCERARDRASGISRIVVQITAAISIGNEARVGRPRTARPIDLSSDANFGVMMAGRTSQESRPKR